MAIDFYCQCDDDVWQVSNNAPTGKVASFKFKVPGKFTAKASYKVYYPGKNGTDNNVTIPATQTQTEPNSTAHFGVSGDCGTADAARANGFHFSLDHQSAVLVFQPYTSNSILNNCYLTKIEVISDNNITGTYTLKPTTGELIGTGSGKEINITTKGSGSYSNGFPLTNNAANLATNGTYMLIQPGEHKLKVRYWIKDYTSDVEAAITKELSSFDYKKNNYYDMTANLNSIGYEPVYTVWDAQKPIWYQHEWDAPNPTDRWQSVINNTASPYYTSLPSDPVVKANMNWSGQHVPYNAINTCKDCPNVNELIWYTLKGDPRWDEDKVWICMGHLRRGGWWIKKKAKIASDEHTTIANMESAAPDGTDWRLSPRDLVSEAENTNISTIPLSTSDVNDYFFLPAFGFYSYLDGKYHSGNSNFWASSGDGKNHNQSAFGMLASKTKINVTSGLSRDLNIMVAYNFE